MSIDIETKGENMRKRKAGVVAAILSASLALSGCGLLPFQQDVPFQKYESKDTETKNTEKTEQQPDEEADADTTQDTDTAEDTQQDTDESEERTDAEEDTQEESPLEQASLMAAQYDYDGAIELLKSQSDYDSNTDMQNAVSEYENIRATCTEYPLEQITHVFFHTLIKDPSKAFDGESDSDGYNQYMTTIDEFNKIIQSMYDEGYVMVSPHDMAIVNEDGTMSRGSIMLPPGKIPFVLSQDDVSYYHYMDGDGFASKLVVDENGEVKNEYIEDDGSVSTGDYDMVPLINTFVKEHPDFSYHGRKGILAMTGYNGVLGYRTDGAYKTGENLQDDQKKFLEEHPDFDFDQEVKEATAVADAMKAEGWEFASHTWGHKNVAERSLEDLQTDDAEWQSYVAPILGKTDMIIFAFGADIGSWEGYTADNAKYEFYKSQGYRYYCNVDSSQYFVQITDDYFRQGRRNLDGYRMYYNPEMLSDLFDVSEVWDSSRPTPVPEM